MHMVHATAEEPSELITSAAENDWIDRRARDLAGAALTDQLPVTVDWLADVVRGEHGFLTDRLALNLLSSALSFEDAPTEAARADFEYCAQRLRAEWIANSWGDYRQAAVNELDGGAAA